MSSLVLRCIAVVLMIIDHIGYTFYDVLPFHMLLRIIGRLAFPVFCFLIAEGLFHTKDVRKYLLRLGIFAFVSELPFDLMITGGRHVIYWDSQNVFLTLFLGLLGILLFDVAAARNKKWLALAAILAAAAGAELLRSDYGAVGILFVFIFYQFRAQPVRLSIAFALAVLVSAASQYTADRSWAFVTLCEIFSLPFLLMYNGARGGEKLKSGAQKALQWAFYLFYPAHLLILVFIHTQIIPG